MASVFIRFLLLKILFLVAVFYGATASLSQDFIDGIHLYNRAEYDSLIHFFAPRFLQDNPHEEGLARYFLAESHYNKALTDADDFRVRTALEAAWREFRFAANDVELKSAFEEFYYFASYKLGWCSFRLAEMGIDPVDKYRQAFQEFRNVPPYAPDSLRLSSYYMAAESKLRESQVLFFSMMESEFDFESTKNLPATEDLVLELYERILNAATSKVTSHNLERFQELVRVKKELALFRYAKFYHSLATTTYNHKIDASARKMFRNRASQLIVRVNFDVLPKGLDPLSPFYALTPYFQMMKHLYDYNLKRQAKSRQTFFNIWRSMDIPDLAAENFFRRGNLHHAHPESESDDFNILAPAYYDSSKSIREAAYWLGYIQMIQGLKKPSRKNFVDYLGQISVDEKLSPREAALFEDARYRKLLLDFENYYLSNDTGKLRNLSKEISAFAPLNDVTQKRKQQLDLLVNCSLTLDSREIWSRVLSGSDNEKTEQALATIRFILPRAALNIGAVRDRYLHLLERLFDITRERRSDETSFFKGIVKSLQAEIEATIGDKENSFRDAANILLTVDENFHNKNEAEYIRARCLFFADDLEGAKSVLIPLINKHHYLRAAFYLAEIFRLDGSGLAARRCYRSIIEKLQDAGNGVDNFWLSNAIAGLESADDSGTLAVLDSVNIEAVVFQPDLKLSLLTYEKLAEEKFLKQNFVQESAEWLMIYGLPIRDFYPSQRQHAANLTVSGNYFDWIPGMIDEMRGPIRSSLVLTVKIPRSVTNEVRVMLGDELLHEIDGVYIRPSIPLNSKLVLKISNPDCYEFKQDYLFNKPGEDSHVVHLNKKLSFVASGKTRNLFADFNYPLGQRPDDNYVFDNLTSLNRNSDLSQDYRNTIELRDLAVDTVNDRILAVNAATNQIWIYSTSGVKKGRLNVSADVILSSPEGITLNSKGQIFLSDWGNHRIITLDSTGQYLGEVGKLGMNSPEDIGQPIKFVFPTRLTVVEGGVDEEARSDFVQDYLYIADYNGVHICKLDGAFLGTLITPNKDFDLGSFYGFLPEGLDQDAKLLLIKRLSKKPGQVFEFNSN